MCFTVVYSRSNAVYLLGMNMVGGFCFVLFFNVYNDVSCPRAFYLLVFYYLGVWIISSNIELFSTCLLSPSHYTYIGDVWKTEQTKTHSISRTFSSQSSGGAWRRSCYTQKYEQKLPTCKTDFPVKPQQGYSGKLVGRDMIIYNNISVRCKTNTDFFRGKSLYQLYQP